MKFSLHKSINIERRRTGCAVFFVPEKGSLKGDAATWDKAAGRAFSRVLKDGDLKGKPGETLLLHRPSGLRAERVLLVGRGDAATLDEDGFRRVLEGALATLGKIPVREACIFLDGIDSGKHPRSWLLQRLACRAGMLSYRYQRTLSNPKPAPALREIALAAPDLGTREHRQALGQGSAIAAGINTARELGNLPGNICTPRYLASQARTLAGGYREMSAEILNKQRLQKLRMGAFLSVSAGSAEPPRLILLHYRGAPKNKKPIVLVGKGITFDSGGISIKPSAAMDEMKFDMCGAASVLGTLHAAAEMQLPINLVGIIAAAENLPSSTATKPGDIITSMSGRTIEVLNTDAEGRLVLCDALSYARRFHPACVVDIATLTGACVIALGSHASALYSNRDELAEELRSAGEMAGDRAWHMPLWDDYQEQLKSNFADVANIGGAKAGSITAACFLSRFATDYPWAHLDIAGVAWRGGAQKGATGRPVGLLSQFLINQSSRN